MDIYCPPGGTGKRVQQHPGSRRESDFMADGWRVFKIMAEFVSGFEMMSDVGPAVTVFGSTRVLTGSAEYHLAERIAELLVAEGFSVGKSYWEGFYRWIKETMQNEKGYISAVDFDFVSIEDSPEEVIAIIKRFYPDGYSLNF